MSDRFDQLRSYIDCHLEEMVELEALLTSTPALAPENGGQGETKKCAALESWLASHGFTHFAHYDATDPRVPSGVRPNLVVDVPGVREGGALWVCTHLDVVPPGDLSLWQQDPWQIKREGDVIKGRGVEDNGQGICSGILAALSFIQQHIIPERTIRLLFMADEEVGSRFGMKHLLESHRELFAKDDRILVPDGGDARGETIEVAEKSILWLRFVIHGKQTHASRPDEGCNAMLAGSYLALKVHELEDAFGERDLLFTPDRSTFSPTLRKANVEGVNIVPGEDVFCADCRILPRYKLDDVRAAVRDVVKRTEDLWHVAITVEEIHAEGSPATPVQSDVAQELAASIKAVHGIDPRFVGIGGGTVAACLRAVGLNAVVFSSMDESAHQANECSRLSNIARDAQTIAYMASDAVT